MAKRNPLKNIESKMESIGMNFLTPSNPANLERDKAVWLSRVRLHLLPALAILFFLGSKFEFISSPDSFLFISFSVLFAIYAIYLFRARENFKASEGFVFLQLILDLTFFSIFLLISKGTWNPFVSVFVVHALLGGMMLKWSKGFLYLALIILFLFLCHFNFYEYDLRASSEGIFIPFVLSFLSLLSFAVAKSLGRHLRVSYENLNRIKIVAERSDRLRAIGALTAGFSHEFASPLNTIKLGLNRFVKNHGTSIPPDEIDELLRAFDKCEAVFKKINSSQSDFRESIDDVINLRDFIQNIIEIWMQENPNMTVVNNVSEDLSIKLPLVSFTQSILNILDNATEANPDTLIVSFATTIDDESIRLMIKDNGPGFSPEVIERRGEPFNTTKETGTGLGIYTTELFLNSLGGYLELGSNNGAVVKMFFPITMLCSDGE